MTYKFFLFIQILIFNFSFANKKNDSIIISGVLERNTKFAVVTFNRFSIGEQTISKASIKDNKFRFALSTDIPKGIYRLRFSQTEIDKYLDIIIDDESEINFRLDITREPFEPMFSKSNQNRDWAEYNKNVSYLITPLFILADFLNVYKLDKENVYKEAESTYSQKRKAIEKLRETFVKLHRNNYIGNYITNNPFWFSNPKEDIILQKFYQRNHIWDNVDTANPALLNSPLYSEKIFNFIKYYLDPELHFPKEQSTEGFKKSVDEIMKLFGENPQTGNFAMEYLYAGFKQMDQEEILRYIDQNYRHRFGIKNVQSLQELEHKLKVYESLKIGTKAPDISFRQTNNSNFKLSNIESKYTVVVFWASWCHYCEKALPDLENYTESNKELKVLAISLDSNRSEFDKAKSQYPAMIHYSDLKAWDSPIAKDYNINATPTFYLLDSEKKIIDKYPNVKDLLKYLEIIVNK